MNAKFEGNIPMNDAADKKIGLFRSRKSRPAVPAGIATALGGDFSTSELQALGRLGTLIQVSVGRELTIEGRVGNEAFVVVDGTANVTRGGEIVATIGSGSVFGEGALITSAPRNATVVATSALSVIVLSPSEFSSLMTACPSLARDIRDLSARRQVPVGAEVLQAAR